MRWRLVLAGLALVATLAACTSKKTIVTDHGTTTIETNQLHHTVKMSNSQGVAIIGRGAVDPKALGLPLYPDAIAAQTGALVTHTKEGTNRIVTLTTKDPFDHVYDWYKGRMPRDSELAHNEVNGGSTAVFAIGKLGDKDQKSVEITQIKDTTTIQLTHTHKNS
jgi:hypothetical protein